MAEHPNTKSMRSESDLLVFVSSRMNDEMAEAREITVETIRGMDFGRPWAFEYTPASSQPADDTYLRMVREADLVIWLVGGETTQPVMAEINTAISAGRRLLVFRLPNEQQDSNTSRLIDRVGGVKWTRVARIEELANYVRDSFGDEIVRAFRNTSPPARSSRLEQEQRLSISRCKQVLTSLGVDENVATEMARDKAIGTQISIAAPGSYTVVGSQGSGKTLAAERLFQRSIESAMEDTLQPAPLFVQARELTMPIKDYVEQSLDGHIDPFNPRVFLIIDGLDELGLSNAANLIRQISIYVDANPGVTAVSTARTLPGLSISGEQIELATLEEEESLHLMGRVLGKPVEALQIHRWPQSIRDSLKLPLFAVMIGALLRDNPELSLASPGELVEQLAAKLVNQSEGNTEDLDRLLQTLAVESINSGARVQFTSISPVSARQALLKNSRLVDEVSNSVDFTLPIYREWYAARALIEGTISLDDLVDISDRWLPALSVILHSRPEELRNQLFSHLILSDPGLASLLLKERSSNLIGLNLPPEASPQIIGEKIRGAMGEWKTALGDLYCEIGPINDAGEVPTIGIELRPQSLTFSWYAGSAKLEPIVNLKDYKSDLRPDWDWPSTFSRQFSDHGSGEPWWHYQETQEWLSQKLEDELRRHSLALHSMDARRELAWNFATDVRRPMGRTPAAVPIGDVLNYIKSLGPNTTVGSYQGWDYRPKDLAILAEYLSELSEEGVTEITNPWPTDDIHVGSGFILNGYSDQRLLERATAIYEGALRIYQSMVERWFMCFARRLSHYRLFPVRLEGWLVATQDNSSIRGDTRCLVWYSRILPEGQQNEAAFKLATSLSTPEIRDLFNGESLYNEEELAFRNHRQGLPGDFVLSSTQSGLIELHQPYPATDLAISWLRGDLDKLGWK